jgi:DnaK suppressor protein
MTSPLSSVRSAPTPRQLAMFRAQLIEQRGFREDQLRLLCRTPAARSSRSAREITAALKAGARTALRDVTVALRRMDEGSYGLCLSCGGQLPIERLEVLPQVARCLPCQRAAEPA